MRVPLWTAFCLHMSAIVLQLSAIVDNAYYTVWFRVPANVDSQDRHHTDPVWSQLGRSSVRPTGSGHYEQVRFQVRQYSLGSA